MQTFYTGNRKKKYKTNVHKEKDIEFTTQVCPSGLLLHIVHFSSLSMVSSLYCLITRVAYPMNQLT